MQNQETTTSLPYDDFDDCPLIRDLLSLYVEDEVTPASRTIIEIHLSDCASCAAFLAGAQSMQSQLSRGPIQRAAFPSKVKGHAPKPPVVPPIQFRAPIHPVASMDPVVPMHPVRQNWLNVCYMILDTIAVLGLCLIGFFSWIIIIETWAYSIGFLGIGLMFLWFTLSLLLVMVYKYGPFTFERLILFSLACILGAGYSVSVVHGGYSGDVRVVGFGVVVILITLGSLIFIQSFLKP
jgi:hypothetical protein